MCALSSQGLLVVIIPVFNEARTIEHLLRRVDAVQVAKAIIVVNDGSTDGTGEILRCWAAEGNGLVITCPVNRGKGVAIRTALVHAEGEFVIVQDADLEYQPNDYYCIVDLLSSGHADVVLGSRYLKGGVRGTPILFRTGVRLLNLTVRLLYGATVTDEATCYKATRLDMLRRMTLQCERFEFCPEMLAKACRMGLRIKEVPISYHPRTAKQGKKIRLRDGWAAIKTLWRYRKWEPPPENKLLGENKLPVASCQPALSLAEGLPVGSAVEPLPVTAPVAAVALPGVEGVATL